MISKFRKISSKSPGNNSIKPVLVYVLLRIRTFWPYLRGPVDSPGSTSQRILWLHNLRFFIGSRISCCFHPNLTGFFPKQFCTRITILLKNASAWFSVEDARRIVLEDNPSEVLTALAFCKETHAQCTILAFALKKGHRSKRRIRNSSRWLIYIMYPFDITKWSCYIIQAVYRPCLFLDIKVLRGRNVTLGTYTDWGEYVYKEVSTRRTAKSTIDSCGPWGFYVQILWR